MHILSLLPSLFVICFFIQLNNCSEDCPRYCQCPKDSHNSRQVFTCGIDPELTVLPCRVRWLNLRLTVVSANLGQNLFRVCNYVEHLTLTANSKVVNLTSYTFLGLQGLLGLVGEQQGSIKQLGANFLEPTPKVTNLKLYRNKVSTITRKTFGKCAQLKTIDITSNLIHTIENDAFATCDFLQNIRLGGNQITIITHKTFSNLPSLRTLFLNNNVISDIEEKSFLSASRLLDLRINGNLLTEIGEAMFANLVALEWLDLSNNRISYIRSNAFTDLVSLKQLKLDGNSLSLLDWSLFFPMQGLQSLGKIQLNCVVEIGPAPNSYVQTTFSRFPLCNGDDRPPRAFTTPALSTIQRSSPNIETKSDSLPLQRLSEPEIGDNISPTIQEVPYIPVWIIIVTSTTSIGFLVTLLSFIGYCKAQNKRLRTLKRRNRSTPLPLLLQTDDCGYLSTAI